MELDEGAIRYYKHGVLDDVISLPALVQVIYEFYYSVEGGISETLSFAREGGKPIKFRIERALKSRQPAFKKFVGLVETWCTARGIPFSRKLGADIKDVTSSRLDDLYKYYTTPARGDPKVWKRKLRGLQASCVFLLFAVLASTSPIFFEITSITRRLFMLGFIFLGPIALSILMVMIDYWLNKKPEPASDPVTRADETCHESVVGLSKRPKLVKVAAMISIVALAMAFMCPVWFIENRLTRVLFTIGLLEFISVGPFLAILYCIWKAPRKRGAGKEGVPLPKKTDFLQIIFLLICLGGAMVLMSLMFPI
ncbi:MAG: hypothetical protein JW839_13845 [Candidatus Lokiarchaeota archaeon]|nr:hypothetical protein [Candidatus Lokiarchaeota archaeon]